MPTTNIIAKVKKIDIQNKIMGEDWKQTITLILGEIELKNDNLIAIRQFRPNEEVLVNLKSLQLSLGDLPAEQKTLMLDRDTDLTPLPDPGAHGPQEPMDLNRPLDATDVVEGAPIEVKIMEDGEDDDVDPACILKSFTF